LSISAEHIHWASYFDLLGFNRNLYTKKLAVNIFFGAKPIARPGNRELSKAGGGVDLVLNIFHFSLV
jgi:hypothetical protein